jgi:hypothetical protein
MHIYAWVVVGSLGLIFLVTGWSPFPIMLGGRRASGDLSGKYIRLVGGCFTAAAALPIIGYRHIGTVLWYSVILILIGFVLLVVGMIRATTGKAL